MAAIAQVTKTLRPRLFLLRKMWGEGSQGRARPAPAWVCDWGRPWGHDCTLSPSRARAQPSQSQAHRYLPLAEVAGRGCLQRCWPLTSYPYFAVPEGTGFPAPVSNYRNLGLLEKRDLESSDPPVVPITGSSLAPPARSLPKDNWRELPTEFHTWRLASSWCRLELGPNA